MKLNLAATALSLGLTGALAQSQPVNVTFLHINDPHSHVNSHNLNVPSNLIPDDLSEPVENLRIFYGGAPRIVGLARKLKEEALAADEEIMFLHAGDALTGTLFATAFGPEFDADWMNAAGVFDAVVLGNHEFDNGDGDVATFVSKLETPVLSHNLRPGPDSPLHELPPDHPIFPHMTVPLSNGDQVGICGVTVKITTELSSNPDPGTTLISEKESVAQCVTELEEQGINKIVLLTHVGYDEDQEDVASVPGVDIVIGGHEHALLGPEATFADFGLTTVGPYATVINGVCVVTAWEYNKVLGALTVEFDEDGGVKSCSGLPYVPFEPNKIENRDVDEDDPVFLNDEDAAKVVASIESVPNFVAMPEDPATAEALEKYRTQIDSVGLSEVATVPEPICHTRRGDGIDRLCEDRPEQSLVGGGVCLLVAQSYLFNVPVADIAIQNAGGCRTDIEAGPLTMQDVFELLPFSNTIITVVLTAQELIQLLEESVGFFLDGEGGNGGYPNGANIRWDLDMQAEFGNRFSNIEIKGDDGVWATIDPSGSYVLATNSFLAGGGDGYSVLSDAIAANPDAFENTYIEYGQSFVNLAENVLVMADPPLSDYSTQYLVNEDGEVISIRALREATMLPTIAKPFEPTAAPNVMEGPTEEQSADDGGEVPTSAASPFTTFIVVCTIVVFFGI